MCIKEEQNISLQSFLPNPTLSSCACQIICAVLTLLPPAELNRSRQVFFGNLDWVFGPCVFLSYHLTWFQRKCSPDGSRKGEGLICGVGEQLMAVWELRMFDGAQFLLGWTNDPWRMFPRVVAAAIEVPDDGEAAREEQKCGNNYNFPPYKI